MPEQTPVAFGNVPQPAIRRAIVEKPEGYGWTNYGPRDQLVALVYHNVLGKARWTGDYFANPNEPHGYRALTDWGVCNTLDGAGWDGVILQWNDPDGRRSPWASGSDGSGAPYGDGAAIMDLCRRLGRNLNQATEAIEISRLRNHDPVSSACLESIVALSAWRVDRKAKVRWDVWPLNNHGLQMTLTHAELGKPGCDAIDVIDAVIDGVRERLKHYQTRGVPVPPPAYQKPAFPAALGAWDGKDRDLSSSRLFACRRVFVARKETPVFVYADRRKPQARRPLAVGEEFLSEYVFEAAGEWWALTASGCRIPLTDCGPTARFAA